MKFKKTVFIDSALHDKICNGDVKLQVGQWIQFPNVRYRSRFVGITASGSFWCVHRRKKSMRTQKTFSIICNRYRNFK